MDDSTTPVSTLTQFPTIPPFPENLPTAPLLRLNLQKLLDDDLDETARLWGACRDVGFFYLDLRDAKGVDTFSESGGDNVNIDGNEVLKGADAMFDLMEEFFELSMEEKNKYNFKAEGKYWGYKALGDGIIDGKGTRDGSESYNVFSQVSKDDMLKLSEPVPQPTVVQTHESLITSYIRSSCSIVSVILNHLNKSLRLPPNTLTRIHRVFGRSGDQLRFIRAPPQPESALKESIGAHTDFGSVTLLFNRLGGLKILPPSSDGCPEDRYDDSKWLWVQPLRGHCTVNLGDAMVKFTRGVLRSNMHKVVNPPGQQANSVRYSHAYFSRPEDDVLLKPLKGSDIIDARREQVPDEPEEFSSKEWVNRRTFGRLGVGEWNKAEGTEGVRAARAGEVA